MVEAYAEANPERTAGRRLRKVLEKLRKIINNHVGIIELAEDLDIETVTEIFIRVNSAGASSRRPTSPCRRSPSTRPTAATCCARPSTTSATSRSRPSSCRDREGRQGLRRLRVLPEDAKWLKDVNDDIYDPTYTDMLRVAFTSEFGRGKLQDLVALLSGRNFETKQYEEAIAESPSPSSRRAFTPSSTRPTSTASR
jgi:hypothetical protein